MNPTLNQVIQFAQSEPIPEYRKKTLQPLINYVQKKVDAKQEVHLNFICTHNSRRSQFSQIWAAVASNHYGVQIHSYSGGVEVTAFNERAVESLKRQGLEITSSGESNPRYVVKFSNDAPSVLAFSKLFDDASSPKEAFAAVMTCSHADENCPFVPGTEQRISVTYEDPKKFDDSVLESSMYDARSLQIASEMFHVFSQIQK